MPANRPSSQLRVERLEARVSGEVKSLCQTAAALDGRSLTDFIVISAVEAARKTIREKEWIELTKRDRTAFVKALLEPAPPPGERLKAAAELHREILG